MADTIFDALPANLEKVVMAHILIMEDDDLLRNTLVRSLIYLGYQVSAYDDAEPALQSVDPTTIDLVVTDLRMPTRGSEAIRTLREKGFTKPILIISGYVVPRDIAHLKAMGANDVLLKPFGVSELGEVLHRLLEPAETP